MTDEEKCRSEFEKLWSKDESHYMAPTRKGSKKYFCPETQSAWKSWQACWKLCGGVK